MELKVLIVDDEPLARSRLRVLLADCTAPWAHVVGEANHAAQAMTWLRGNTADVVLLDIHMPGADGLTLARALRKLPHPPCVVFVTAYAEHAVQAFELDAVDYLTKPVRLERLQASLQKVERHIRTSRGPEPVLMPKSDEFLLIQERGRTQRVPLSEVVYFKAELKYITVRTQDKSHILDGSLAELEEKYAEHFMRIHRNALIAKRAVRALEKVNDPQEGEGWAVRLHSIEEPLLVSRRQLPAVRALIAA